MTRIISIDVDGILANFVKALMRTAIPMFPGRELNENYVTSNWNFTELFSQEEFSTIWRRIRATEGFWLGVESYHENINALWDANLRGVDTYFTTSRVDTGSMSALKQTDRWFRYNNIEDQGSIVVVKDASEKANVFHALGVQASIDDYYPTALASSGLPNHDSWLLRRPWNEQFIGAAEEKGIRVVSSLEPFLAAQIAAVKPAD